MAPYLPARAGIIAREQERCTRTHRQRPYLPKKAPSGGLAGVDSEAGAAVNRLTLHEPALENLRAISRNTCSDVALASDNPKEP